MVHVLRTIVDTDRIMATVQSKTDIVSFQVRMSRYRDY